MISKELAVYQGDRYAVTQAGGAAAGLLQESLAPGESLDVFNLPLVRVPAGGGRAFDLGGEVVTNFEGVIILRQPVRGYWRASLAATGGGAPPDCASGDSIVGVGEPGGSCAHCGLARYGTATGDDGSGKAGQACRQITRLFVLRQESLLPLMVSLPPSSYKTAKDYVISLGMTHRRHYSSVVTRIGLEIDQSRDGIKYAKVKLELASLLSDEDSAAVAVYRDNILDALRGVPQQGDML